MLIAFQSFLSTHISINSEIFESVIIYSQIAFFSKTLFPGNHSLNIVEATDYNLANYVDDLIKYLAFTTEINGNSTNISICNQLLFGELH